ncbi:MAG TPA: flagellar biosynthetic protein FliO [Candidatus Binatia bacterium]|jgi:flagellar biogenesis protein FliO
MFTMFHRQLARPSATRSDLATAANYLLRWLPLPARRQTAHSLQLLESVPLNAQASVALVRFETESLVLGVTAQSVTVLAKGAFPAGARNCAPLTDETHS